METYLKKDDSAALKGLAILLMMYHHCFRDVKFFKGYDVIFDPFGVEQAVSLGLWAKVCVPIFAFVSGYGLFISFSMNNSNKGYGKWALKRILATLSGYWFVAVFSYIVIFALNFFMFGADKLLKVLDGYGDTVFERVVAIASDILGVSSLFDTRSLNGAWWYMGTALALIIILPLLSGLEERIGAFSSILLVVFVPGIFDVNVGGTSVYAYVLIFFCGMLCCKYDAFSRIHELRLSKSVVFNNIIKLIILLLLVIIGILTYDDLSKETYWWYHFAVVPFFVIVLCVEYLNKITIIKKVLVFLGNNSLNVWLIHTFFRNYGKGFIWSGRWFLLAPVIMLMVSLVTSLVIDFIKRQCGYDRLINRALSGIK